MRSLVVFLMLVVACLTACTPGTPQDKFSRMTDDAGYSVGGKPFYKNGAWQAYLITGDCELLVAAPEAGRNEGFSSFTIKEVNSVPFKEVLPSEDAELEAKELRSLMKKIGRPC